MFQWIDRYQHTNNQQLDVRKSGSFILIGFFLIIGFTSLVFAQSAQKIKSQDMETREQMQIMSRQLGVTCVECHNLKDFTENKKPNFKTGLAHMKIVELLKQNGMDGKNGPAASCFMCHRGELKPAYKEKPNEIKVK